MTPEEWRPLAKALQAALERARSESSTLGLTNFAGILRPLGTLNTKYDPFRRCASLSATWARLRSDAFESASGSVHVQRQPLAHDPDHEVAPDLAELIDAVEYRSARGDYARGNYHRDARAAFRARASCHRQAGIARRRVGYHPARCRRERPRSRINESRFEEALTRTADRRHLTMPLTTPRSIFRGALAAGWLPPHPEDDLSDEQRILLGRAKRKLWDIFRDGHHRGDAADDAARLAGRIKDP